MPVITISRQLGSGGDTVAHMVASSLNYKLVHKEEMILEGKKRGLEEFQDIEEVGEGKPSLRETFDKKKSKAVYALRTMLRKLAAEGDVVIVGRGGQVELQNNPTVTHIRIVADFETRVRRVMREAGLGRSQAVQAIKETDRERAEYVKYFFFANSANPELYDLVINTRRVSLDWATQLILSLVAARLRSEE